MSLEPPSAEGGIPLLQKAPQRGEFQAPTGLERGEKHKWGFPLIANFGLNVDKIQERDLAVYGSIVIFPFPCFSCGRLKVISRRDRVFVNILIILYRKSVPTPHSPPVNREGKFLSANLIVQISLHRMLNICT